MLCVCMWGCTDIEVPMLCVHVGLYWYRGSHAVCACGVVLV